MNITLNCTYFTDSLQVEALLQSYQNDNLSIIFCGHNIFLYIYTYMLNVITGKYDNPKHGLTTPFKIGTCLNTENQHF